MPHLRRVYFFAGFVAALLTLSPTHVGADEEPTICNFESCHIFLFDRSSGGIQPRNYQLRPGAIAEWLHHGPIKDHKIVSGKPGAPDSKFVSGILRPGDFYRVMFNESGTYPYFDSIENMTGTIIVKGQPIPEFSSALYFVLPTMMAILLAVGRFFIRKR